MTCNIKHSNLQLPRDTSSVAVAILQRLIPKGRGSEKRPYDESFEFMQSSCQKFCMVIVVSNSPRSTLISVWTMMMVIRLIIRQNFMTSEEALTNCLVLLHGAPPILFSVTSFPTLPTNSLAVPSPSLGVYLCNKHMWNLCEQNFTIVFAPICSISTGSTFYQWE